MDPQKSFWHYFRGWFFIDIVASFPGEVSSAFLTWFYWTVSNCRGINKSFIHLKQLVCVLCVTHNYINPLILFSLLQLSFSFSTPSSLLLSLRRSIVNRWRFSNTSRSRNCWEWDVLWSISSSTPSTRESCRWWLGSCGPCTSEVVPLLSLWQKATPTLTYLKICHICKLLVFPDFNLLGRSTQVYLVCLSVCLSVCHAREVVG